MMQGHDYFMICAVRNLGSTVFKIASAFLFRELIYADLLTIVFLKSITFPTSVSLCIFFGL